MLSQHGSAFPAACCSEAQIPPQGLQGCFNLNFISTILIIELQNIQDIFKVDFQNIHDKFKLCFQDGWI
jgi:hypothetical protein